MKGGERALPYLEAVRMRWWLRLLLLAGPLACIGAGLVIASKNDLRTAGIVGLTGLVVALFLLGFSKLRIYADSSIVRLRFGPFGTTIPRERIERADVCSYSWLTYAGWGIRVGFDGSFGYTVPGDGGHGVRLVYRTKRGRRRTVVFSSRTPQQLVHALGF